jgi:hypothetical protein
MSKRIGRWTYDGSEPLPGWHLDKIASSRKGSAQ